MTLVECIRHIMSHNVPDEDSYLKGYFCKSRCKEIELLTKEQSSCEHWHKHRQCRITASKFGEVFKRRTLTSSYAQKFIFPRSELRTQAIEWGRKNEEVALRMYVQKAKSIHTNFQHRRSGLCLNSKFPHLGASPDAHVLCSCCGKGIVEIKCPFKHKNVSAFNINDSSFILDTDGKIRTNHSYYFQIQGQLAVTEEDYCDMIIWTSVDFAVYRVKQNKEVWKKSGSLYTKG
nr:uncharacterized protein LOC122268294 [Parasteatoda tepidariorum]